MALAQLKDIISANDDLPPGVEPGSVEHILRTIRSHLDMDIAFVSHIASENVTIRNTDARGLAPMKAGDVFPAEEGYCQRIVQGRIPFLIPDTAVVPEVATLGCTLNIPIGAHMSVPLRLSDGSIYGTFCCFSHLPNHTLNQRDLQMMHAFAELAAAQIDVSLRLEHRAAENSARIARIIEQDELTMAYQPIYSLANPEVVGLECLARFPDSEVRPPDTWFTEAFEIGLGVDLELTAVRSALRALPYLPDDIYLAINLSPATIISGKVAKILEGVPPDRLVLEVTEHAVVRDYLELHRALEPLRAGARIAIDDAGAGYSGLTHILEIRPDLIKLDMSLTRGIDSDPTRFALATALVTFASQIGCQIVAEGIETSAELEALHRLGVDFGQGYFLRRPMPLAAAAQFLIARRAADVGPAPEVTGSPEIDSGGARAAGTHSVGCQAVLTS
jgi:EAL domain-containing protein (putative c-di-GMP-specific phosphodiesterase class I)